MSDRGRVPFVSRAVSHPGDAAVDRGVGAAPQRTLLSHKDLEQGTLDLSPGSGVDDAAVGALLRSESVSLSDLFASDPESLRAAVTQVRALAARVRRNLQRGVPLTLGVVWGMATWESESASTPSAPVLLRRVSVARRGGAGDDYEVGLLGPWALNPTLLPVLATGFSLDVDEAALVDAVHAVADAVDGEALFAHITTTASAVPGFAIARRVVLTTMPSAAVGGDEGPLPRPPAAVGSDQLGTTASRTLELVRGAMLDPSTVQPGSPEWDLLFGLGPDAVIAEIVAALRADGWPEALVEHADSGLRVRDAGELLQRWYDAGHERARPSQWDATHFGLWGLVAAPTPGSPAIRAVARWEERKQHPILQAWQIVAQRRYRRRSRWARWLPRRRRRVTIPRGIGPGLWGLPVDLFVPWADWVFRQWPGAPIELVLPPGTPEFLTAWYERARPVTELALHTWVPFAAVDDALGRALGRWVRDLAVACDGGGAPMAEWLETSAAAATAAVALRLGDAAAAGHPHRGRRKAQRATNGPTRAGARRAV